MSFTDHDVAEVRHVVQRILVPCVFVIGLLGNSVSIYVLTRRRMRCTTNIYLTALAITDIIYLTIALLLSLQHYQYVHLYWKIYWMCYGVLSWLVDACAYISIYIAVCFTIERFIAIRYPLKRQKFCTESLAKKVIAGVTLFCLLSTISTAFEHQHSIEYRMIDNFGQPCNQTIANIKNLNKFSTLHHHHETTAAVPKMSEKLLEFIGEEGSGDGDTTNDIDFISPNIKDVLHRLSSSLAQIEQRDKFKRSLILTERNQEMEAMSTRTLTNIPITNLPLINTLLPSSSAREAAQQQQYPLESAALLKDTIDFEMRNGDDDNMEMMMVMARPPPLLKQMDLSNWENDTELQMLEDHFFNITEYCENKTYYNHKLTALGNDEFYYTTWYFVTLFVFVLVPLCVLVTFNCFLIMLVRRSTAIRGEMTNASSMRRPKRKSTTSSVSQENRVTITLIAVVLLFIICQLPWAIYLVVDVSIQIEDNLKRIFGNIFNFLAALNAAANFFLYCVLSDKYRKTVRELITGYRYKQQRNTLTTTSLYTNGSRRSYRPASSSMVIK